MYVWIMCVCAGQIMPTQSVLKVSELCRFATHSNVGSKFRVAQTCSNFSFQLVIFETGNNKYPIVPHAIRFILIVVGLSRASGKWLGNFSFIWKCGNSSFFFENVATMTYSSIFIHEYTLRFKEQKGSSLKTRSWRCHIFLSLNNIPPCLFYESSLHFLSL